MDLTKILAIYAAFLSTAVFAWNVSRARPKIRVKLIFTVEQVEGEYVHGVRVAVQNPSQHTVHLSNISLLYPWRRPKAKDYLEHIFRFRRWPGRMGWVHTSLSNYDIEDGCPVALEPGTSHSVLVPEGKLEKLLVDARKRRFSAVVQDALWRNKYSPTFEYPIVPKQSDEAEQAPTVEIEQKDAAPKDAV